jgi:hypothetical protein
MIRALLLSLLTAAMALAADVTGSWSFAVETDVGSGTPAFTFKQSGEKITGNYRGQLGEAPLAGTVQGNKITFSFEISPTGDKLTVVYTGTVEGDKAMKGSIDFGGQAKGTFTGTKN